MSELRRCRCGDPIDPPRGPRGHWYRQCRACRTSGSRRLRVRLGKKVPSHYYTPALEQAEMGLLPNLAGDPTRLPLELRRVPPARQRAVPARSLRLLPLPALPATDGQVSLRHYSVRFRRRSVPGESVLEEWQVIITAQTRRAAEKRAWADLKRARLYLDGWEVAAVTFVGS